MWNFFILLLGCFFVYRNIRSMLTVDNSVSENSIELPPNTEIYINGFSLQDFRATPKIKNIVELVLMLNDAEQCGDVGKADQLSAALRNLGVTVDIKLV